MEDRYPICLNLDNRTWSALVFLRRAAEEVDPERLMCEALLRAARDRGWQDPGSPLPG